MSKIACIGGGSGGHILPIVILHERLKLTRAAECVWIGEIGGMDQDKAREHGIEFYPIQGIKFRRQFSLRNLLQPYFFIVSLFQSYQALKTIQPMVIFCKGGGVALPVGICAWMMKIPMYVHESDTVPGITNRILGRLAKRVFLGFESARVFFGEVPTECVGQWIDPIFTKYISEHPWKRNPGTYTSRVVVQCGGLGSTMIFKNLLKCLKNFPNIHFTIALGTLNEHFYEHFLEYPNVHVKKWFFHEELAEAYAQADVALVRAAATTLAECDVFGLRIIMVPLGISSFNHQYLNAIASQKRNPQHILLEESRLSELGAILHSLENYQKSGYGTDTKSAIDSVIPVLLAESNRRVK